MSLETTETTATALDHRGPTSGTADDEHRRRLHGMWAAVAPSWEHHADYVDARGEAVTRELLAAAALRPGDGGAGAGLRTRRVWASPWPRSSVPRARSSSRTSCRR